MGTRGPQSSAPGGYGIITREGYRRVWCTTERRYRMEHNVVWERSTGQRIPLGHEIHHRDENPLNNSIDNLQLLSRLDHKRVHSGCELRADGWWKPCRRCEQVHPIGAFRASRGWPDSYCKPCRARMSVEHKRAKRAAQEAHA